jgi:hypothetical protein
MPSNLEDFSGSNKMSEDSNNIDNSSSDRVSGIKGATMSSNGEDLNGDNKMSKDVKLPENRQSDTSLGKCVNGGRIKILHVEGCQALKQTPRTHN